MAREGSRRGVDVAIVIGVLVMVGCGFWLGYLVGRQSLADDLGSAFESFVSAEQASGQSSKEGAQGRQAASSDDAVAAQGDVTFDGATMSVTFKGIEDVPYLDGACNISLIAENRSDTPCTFAIDLQNATASGYGVTPIGGSLSVVQPGNKVILVYNLAYKQFGGVSIDDLTDFTADIVQYRGESMMNADGSTTEIDRVHVSVEP